MILGAIILGEYLGKTKTREIGNHPIEDDEQQQDKQRKTLPQGLVELIPDEEIDRG
jgi:hypothetical protein